MLMAVSQLSSKCLSELRAVLQKATRERDDKLAAFAQAAIEDLNRRLKEKSGGNSNETGKYVGAARSVVAEDDGKNPV